LVLASLGLSIGVVLELLVATGTLQIICLLAFGQSTLVGRWKTIPLGPVLAFGTVFWINLAVEFFLGRFGDVFLLSVLLPERTFASLYDVASSLNQAALLAATAGFAGISFAKLARLAATQPESMNRFYITLVRAISFITIPLFAFLLFHGEGVVTVLYSSSFAGAASVLQILVLFRLCSRLFAGGENAEYLLSKGKVLPLVAIGLVAAFVNIGLDILLIPFYGAQGAAVATGIANLLVNALAWRLVRNAGGPKLQLLFWVRLTIISLVSSWIVALVFGDMVFFAGCAYVILGVVAAWLIRPLRPEDVDALASLHPAFARWAGPFVRQG
jgi:O-antigen/teichoic acid export membrane protein